ncbi:hypothetical protein SAMN04487774_10313 [Enterococcus faecalis]|nr:hypothetical protein P788_0873 [Enterococcus faecalis MTUP9]SDN56614.1 hypothetical protein SAMN04487774_10313 [Enterococcus faecalis]
MKANYVQANEEIKHTDHNDLVDDTKELEIKISQIPAGPKGDKGDTGAQGPKGDKGSDGTNGKDGLGVKAIELTKDASGQIVSGTMTMTDGTIAPISVNAKKVEEF